MIDYNNGISATYYATRVDPKTWADAGEISIISGEVTKNATSALVVSADITVNEDMGAEDWVRVYMIAEQNG